MQVTTVCCFACCFPLFICKHLELYLTVMVLLLLLAVVGAGATIWATNLISNAASAAIEGSSASEEGSSGPTSNGKGS
jgi:hypothetical protein